MSSTTAPPARPNRTASPPRMPNRALSPPRMKRRPNLSVAAGSSARKLCITDNILDHPQFQPTTKKQSRSLPRPTKSFELPRISSSSARRPMRRTHSNAMHSNGLGDQAHDLFAMAVSLKDTGMAQVQKVWDPNASFSKQPEHEDMFERDLERLTYTKRDVQSIVFEDDQAFRILKASLRQRGCVTNAYLKENVHFYIRHVKDVRQQRMAEEAKQRKRELSRRHRVNLRPKVSHNAAA